MFKASKETEKDLKKDLLKLTESIDDIKIQMENILNRINKLEERVGIVK